MIRFLSRTPVLFILFGLTIAIMISFESVRAAAGDPLLDMLMTGADAQARLAAMSAEAKQAHFWGTVLNDTAYPLAYGSLFAGLAFRFGAPKLIYGLPSFAGAFIDLCENTIQALALSDTVDLLAAKSVLTPLKFALVAAAAGLALILMARALWQNSSPSGVNPMSEAPIVLVERDGPVAIVTLNRPDALNALSRALRAEIVRVFTELAKDDTVRVAVLTGAGRAFTAGVDLKEAGQTGFALGADGGDIDLAKGLAAFPWPIIGAINGFAITGGFELALMCDVLIASENAKFADTHARVGIMPGWGLSQKLSRLIGISRAKELSFTGNFLDAETAERWGLVNRVYAADELVPAAVKMAHEMSSCDPVLLRNYKAVIDEGYAMSFGEGSRMEVKRSAEHAASVTAESVEEARKAVTARGREKQS